MIKSAIISLSLLLSGCAGMDGILERPVVQATMCIVQAPEFRELRENPDLARARAIEAKRVIDEAVAQIKAGTWKPSAMDLALLDRAVSTALYIVDCIQDAKAKANTDEVLAG